MKTFQGKILYREYKAFLILTEAQETLLLLIKGENFTETYNILCDSGIADGENVSITGESNFHTTLAWHPECASVLFFTVESLIKN